MKIAALICGHSRTFEFCIPNWQEKLYSQYKIDTYFYTWNIKGTRLDDIPDTAQQWDNNKAGTHDFKPLLDQTIISKQKIDSLLSSLGSQRTKVRVYDASKTQLITPTPSSEFNNISHFCPMLFLLKQAFEKMRTTDDYDFVLRFRPDAIFMSPEPLILTNCKKLQIPIYSSSWGPHDYFAYGPFELMQKYCMLYDSVAELLKNPGIKDSHSALNTFLIENRIPFEDSIKFRMSFIRKNYIKEFYDKRDQHIDQLPNDIPL